MPAFPLRYLTKTVQNNTKTKICAVDLFRNLLCFWCFLFHKKIKLQSQSEIRYYEIVIHNIANASFTVRNVQKVIEVHRIAQVTKLKNAVAAFEIKILRILLDIRSNCADTRREKI